MRKNLYRFLLAQPWTPVYDDPPPPPPPAGDPPPPPKDPPAGKTFTQEEVNAIVAKEKAKHRQEVETRVTELENLKKSKSLTDQDRTQLQTQIDELKNTLLTKEQLAAKEQDRLRNQHKGELDSVTKERDDWKGRYTKATIERSILDSAVAEEGFNPDQFIAVLSPHTRLVEEIGADGNPTGNLVPKVKFQDKDKEGKPVALDLTTGEAVKRMKELPQFANFFKAAVNGGLGSGRTSATGNVDVASMTPEQYREYRKTAGLAPKPKPGAQRAG